jgi:hypothetical protein
MAHVHRGGVYQFGVRVVIPDGREVIWDSDNTASIEAQIMRDGMLVGFVPRVPGSGELDDQGVVDLIAGTDYDAPSIPQSRPREPGPAGAPAGFRPASTRKPLPPPARGRGVFDRLRNRNR